MQASYGIKSLRVSIFERAVRFLDRYLAVVRFSRSALRYYLRNLRLSEPPTDKVMQDAQIAEEPRTVRYTIDEISNEQAAFAESGAVCARSCAAVESTGCCRCVARLADGWLPGHGADFG